MLLKHLALVAIGGGLGSALRFLVSIWAVRLATSVPSGAHGQAPGSPGAVASPGVVVATMFPWGTLAVNLAGCLAIGVIAGATAHRSPEGISAVPFAGMGRDAKLLVVTGFLGGFTTFSAFGLETASLLREGAVAKAGVYIGVSVLAGLALVWAGWTLGLRFAPSGAHP